MTDNSDGLDIPPWADRRPKKPDALTVEAVSIDFPAAAPLIAELEALVNGEKSPGREPTQRLNAMAESRKESAKVVLELEVDRYIDDIVKKMKAHLANIDGAQVTMVNETKKAALLLIEARNKYPDRERDICKRVGVTFEGTRYYELLSIGAGRKSIAQIKDANAKRKRDERDRKKALPKPAPKLAPAPPAPIVKLTPRADPVVRDVTDRKPETESTAAPKMLSAEQAMSLIYPILEKVETQALVSVATQVSAYSARRRNATKSQANREDVRV